MVSPKLVYPPGFRFHPNDEELVGYYLERKVCGEEIEGNIIPDVDLYKIEPWDLPESSVLPASDRYFFSPRDKKYPHGGRTNRATLKGYWKATGKDRAIGGTPGVPQGWKKTLVFYLGRAPNGKRTDWVMHEYRLDDSGRQGKASQSSYVLCRIFNKKGDYKDAGPAVVSPPKMATDEDATSSHMVPPLLAADEDQLFCEDGGEADTGRDLLAQYNLQTGGGLALELPKQESFSDACEEAPVLTPGKPLLPALCAEEDDQGFDGDVLPESTTVPKPHPDQQFVYPDGTSGPVPPLWHTSVGDPDHEFDLRSYGQDGSKLSLDELRDLLIDAPVGEVVVHEPEEGLGHEGPDVLLDGMFQPGAGPHHDAGAGYGEVDSWFSSDPHMDRGRGGQNHLEGGSAEVNRAATSGNPGSSLGWNSSGSRWRGPGLGQTGFPQRGQVAARGTPAFFGRLANGMKFSGDAVKQEPVLGEVADGEVATGAGVSGGQISVRPRAYQSLTAGTRPGGVDVSNRRIRMAVPIRRSSSDSPSGSWKSGDDEKVTAGHCRESPGSPQTLKQMLKEAAEASSRKVLQRKGGGSAVSSPHSQAKKELPQALLKELASRLAGGKQQEAAEDEDVQEITQADLEAAMAAKSASTSGRGSASGKDMQNGGHLANDHASEAGAGVPPYGYAPDGSHADAGNFARSVWGEREDGEEEKTSESGGGQSFWEAAMEAAEEFARESGSGRQLGMEVDEEGGMGSEKEPVGNGVMESGAPDSGNDSIYVFRQVRPEEGAPRGPEATSDSSRELQAAETDKSLEKEDEGELDGDTDDDEEDLSMTCARVRLVPDYGKANRSMPSGKQEGLQASGVNRGSESNRPIISQSMPASIPRRQVARSQAGAQPLPQSLQSFLRLLGPVLPANAAEIPSGSSRMALGHLRGSLSSPAILRGDQTLCRGGEGSPREGVRGKESTEGDSETVKGSRGSSGMNGQQDSVPGVGPSLVEKVISTRSVLDDRIARRHAGVRLRERRQGGDEVESARGQWSGMGREGMESAFVRRRPVFSAKRPQPGGLSVWLGMLVATFSLCVGVVSLAKLAVRALAHGW